MFPFATRLLSEGFARWALVCCLLGLLAPLGVNAQDDEMDLDALLEEASEPAPQYTIATFKGTRLINGHTVETPAAKHLIFMIQHRFGLIKEGFDNFFGLDQARVRLGLIYGITDWLSVGLGRASWEKTVDGYVKAKILRQQTGKRNIPITLTAVGGVYWNTQASPDPDNTLGFVPRLDYMTQLLIARKFTPKLSLQLMPTFFHRNWVETPQEEHNIFALGLGGRYKITKRFAITAEYYALMPGHTRNNFYDAASVGVDIETGGHVFQVFVTNANRIVENGFVPATVYNWGEGELLLGFNITRIFSLDRKAKGSVSWE